MNRPYRAKIKHFLGRYRRQSVFAAAIVLFAVVGLVFMSFSSAATTTVALEAENGTVSRSDMVLPDVGASGNSYVKFTAGGGGPNPGTQTLGPGGVATPAGAIEATSDSDSELNIDSGGTAENPKVYDGKGHKIGTINIDASYVVVQNYYINATGQYGVYATGDHITIQNNDIKGVHASGDGDLNAITFFGDNISILYNSAIDFVTGDPGGSHTDAIQTWNTDSKRPSSNIVIGWNKFVGPDRDSGSPIHQCVMAEGTDSTDGGGGGSGNSENWLVIGNYFKDDWNQCLKFDDIDNVSVTRNEFAGSSSHVVEATSLSSGFKFYDDNVISGNYGDSPDTVPGPGPTSL